MPDDLTESFQVFSLGDDDDTVVRDSESTLEIGFAVPADLKPARYVDFLVDDRPANACVASDVNTIEEYRIFDKCKTVDSHAQVRQCCDRPGPPR